LTRLLDLVLELAAYSEAETFSGPRQRLTGTCCSSRPPYARASTSKMRTVKSPIGEAKGEDYGTNIWTRTYRGSSSYSGVRRTGWSS
jgi:hypothetical protein